MRSRCRRHQCGDSGQNNMRDWFLRKAQREMKTAGQGETKRQKHHQRGKRKGRSRESRASSRSRLWATYVIHLSLPCLLGLFPILNDN